MKYLYVLCLALGSVIVLFFLTKLVGNRQINQLSLFDYIVGITIGSIAAEMATDVDENFFYAVIAMAVYAVLAYVLSVLADRNLRLRKFLGGRALVLMQNGNLYKENFKKARLDLSEFLSQCRIAGYFDISVLDTVFLEANGKLSILPKTEISPLTPKDAGVKTDKAQIAEVLVTDGVLIKSNLQKINRNEQWLFLQLTSFGAQHISQVFLATYCNNKLSVFLQNTPE